MIFKDQYNENSRFEKKANGKRKHVTLTIQQKLEIIDRVEQKESRQSIATLFGIGKSTVHDIHKRRDQIRGFAEVHNSNDISKRRRVDQKAFQKANAVPRSFTSKDELSIKAEDETIDSIDGFEYQEISDQEYEIVYDADLHETREECVEEPKLEASPKSKRPSKTLTFREKYHVIQEVENGASVPSVCEAYGIGRTTVYDYMRRKQEIIEFVEKTNDGHRKTFKKSKFPEVEEQVLDWCESRETFMKQQFYDCAKAAFENAKDQGSVTSPSGFCGSWSWAKRFFHRHPDLRKKLVTASGEPLDLAELSLTNSEYLEETIPFENTRTSLATKKPVKHLTMAEKHEVLNEIDAGQSVQAIADTYEVSKSQIYEIFKRRLELRNSKLDKLDPNRKMNKRPRFPQLELELLRWCLQQQNFPLSYVLIADKASCLFETLELTGYCNPSSSWAKKFVLRHPELSEKQGLLDETPEDNAVEGLLNDFPEHAKEENDDCEEDGETFELIDASDLNTEYQEEYIVEEIELEPNEEDDLVTEIKFESHETSNEIKIKDTTSNLIPDQIAMKSLKILVRYAEQQGHEDMMSQLLDYQSQLSVKI